jgi:hypothetical protein
VETRRMARAGTLLCSMVAALALGTASAGTPPLASVTAAPGLAGPRPYSCSPQEQAFLDQVEHDTFEFFWTATPAASGLTPDRSPGPDV